MTGFSTVKAFECSDPERLLAILSTPGADGNGGPRGDADDGRGITMQDGRYLLTGVAGRGGMATVFSALDTLLQAPRALKIGLPGRCTHAQRRARMRQEAEVMARIRHRHVGTLFDFVTTDVTDYLVLELVDGLTVRDAMRDGLPQPAALRMVAQTLTALSAVHVAGVVHRDVKPTNVMLTQTGDAKLLDFGIALLAGEATRLTAPGFMMGTFAYMAPEQVNSTQELDHLVDIYAMGCLLFTALGGGVPSELWGEPRLSTRWDAIPRRYVPLVVRSVDRSRDRRFPSAGDMLDALLDVADELTPDADGIREVLVQTTGSRRVPSLSPAIAVVDPDPSIGALITTMLPDLRPEVLSYQSGGDFLASSEHVDLILLDLGGPEGDGFGTLQRIRDHVDLAQVPVIVMTRAASGSGIERALTMGADDYVTKPFGTLALRTRVVRWLHGDSTIEF